MPFRRTPRCLGLIAVAAIALLGCGPTTNSPVPTQVADRCVDPLPEALVDALRGYSLCMPAGWHDMAPGDPAWAQISGGEITEMENNVRNGRFDHFAVPLDQGEDFAAQLTIHGQEILPTDTLEEHRDRYIDAYLDIGAELLASEIVDIGGVPAARLAFGPSEADHEVFGDGRLIVYLLVDESPATIYVLFNAKRDVADEYEPIFHAMAGTIRLE